MTVIASMVFLTQAIPTDTSPSNPILEKRDSFSCGGTSSLCNNGDAFITACNRARDLIDPGRLYFTGGG